MSQLQQHSEPDHLGAAYSGAGLASPRRFLVTTTGLTASRWLSFALASHPDVFVSHGKHPLDSVLNGSFTREKKIDDKESFTLGNKMAPFYQDTPLDQIFGAFSVLKPGARAVGNVHAFTIDALHNKVARKQELAGIAMLNVVRHPVSFIASHYRLVKSAEQHAELYQHYSGTLFEQACEAFPEIRLYDHIPEADLIAFAVSCFGVHNWRHDFCHPEVESFPMERLTAEVELLQPFCEQLTSLSYDRDALAQQIQRGPINRHRQGKRRLQPDQVFAAWSEWQRDLAVMMMPPQVLDQLEQLGYDVSMLRLPGERAPAACRHAPAQDAAHPAPAPEAPAVDDELAQLFAAGNYAEVALRGDRDRWETHAALGLVGRTADAIAGLEGFEHQQARFYSAVASWIGGDDQRAERLLAGVPTEHAQNLRTLIARPQIVVLAQLPWNRSGPSDLVSFVEADPKFKVLNHTFHMDDLGNEPYADVARLGLEGHPPDFFLCQMVEWQVTPPNLQQLDIPLIGHTADFDLHIQGVHPWLQLFDQLMVTDQTEWQHARGVVDVPLHTFPKSFGLHPCEDPAPSGERPIDVFQSGSAVHPYHQDKLPCLEQMMALPDPCARLLIEGFTAPAVYWRILGSSKATFTHVRHAGAMPTRAIEALSMGCVAVVQQGSCLNIFAGQEEGVLSYDPGEGGLARALEQVIRRWPEWRARGQRGALRVRQEFALDRVASQYLRFATFLAARPRAARKPVDPATLTQKRMIMAKGWLPGPPPVQAAISQACLERWHQRRAHGSATARDYIDETRELVLALLTGLPIHAQPAAQRDFVSRAGDLGAGIFNPAEAFPLRPMGRALELFRQGLERFGDCLPLRFNYIRSVLHLGHPEEVDRALELARQTLARPLEQWDVDPLEDVFPWDFCSSFFNYRVYFDQVTEDLGRGASGSPALARLICASLHYYLSFYQDPREHAEQAVALDPEFPFYAFRLAHALTADPARRHEALELLAAQGAKLVYSLDAVQLLNELAGDGASGVDPRVLKINRLVVRMEQARNLIDRDRVPVQDMGNWRGGMLQAPSAAG